MSANFQEQAQVLQQAGFNEEAVSSLLAAQSKPSTPSASSQSKASQEQKQPQSSQTSQPKPTTTASPAPSTNTTKPLPVAPVEKQQKSGTATGSPSTTAASSPATLRNSAATQKSEPVAQTQKSTPQVVEAKPTQTQPQTNSQPANSQYISKQNATARSSTYASAEKQSQTQTTQPSETRAQSSSTSSISTSDKSKNTASSGSNDSAQKTASRVEDTKSATSSTSKPSLQNQPQAQQPAKQPTPVQPPAPTPPPVSQPPPPTPKDVVEDAPPPAFDAADDMSIDNIDQSLVELNEEDNEGMQFDMQDFGEENAGENDTQQNEGNDAAEDGQPQEEGMDISQFLGVHSDPGARYGDCNQDSLLCCKTGDNGFIVGVFDGHGVNGEIASDVARQVFEEYFESRDIFAVSREDQEHMIREVFQLSHQRILETYEELVDVVYNGYQFQLQEMDGLLVYHNDDYGTMLQDFGTTAVIAAVKSNGQEACEILIANVGDSLALIGRSNKEGGLDAIEDLCDIHNGSNTNERQRVNAFGLNVNDSDSYLSPPPESGFDWAQLAVSRSLGHRYFSEYGVTWEPFISSYILHPDDKYLVITSDGVTDVLAGDDILKIVTHCIVPFNGDLQRVTMKLVSYCISQWPNEADNTTAIILDLKQTPTP